LALPSAGAHLLRWPHGNAVHLLIDLLQLQFNQFTQDDPILSGLFESRIAKTFPFGFEAFQTGHCFCQPQTDLGAWYGLEIFALACPLQFRRWHTA
jgi:hypothetical protein